MEERLKADLETWSLRWKGAAPELERVRKKEAVLFDVGKTIDSFNDAFASALKMVPLIPDSGLVEQQRLFSLFRK